MYTGTYTEDAQRHKDPYPEILKRVTSEDLQLQLMLLGDFLGAAGQVRSVTAVCFDHVKESAALYTAAERLLMPELKILSLRRFGFFACLLEQSGLELDSGNVRCLSDIVRIIYSGTTSTDLAIKEPLCRITNHFMSINKRQALYPRLDMQRLRPIIRTKPDLETEQTSQLAVDARDKSLLHLGKPVRRWC
ncbi:hypothetical protein PpBr36_07791 [Pyricularia pennisetigena]|uniref:hypothetical protein n=1 Tax=Pyricularia pennisetigena TaxID=1578925 RepID=UPI00114E4CB8|nr:hypothetical protein PpBr36_07791 [Pyricularia pennisetigena]TLS25605.1 hypothetical protein PpBr36_07791 [Pyricularia pennisetigena]